MGYTDAGGGIYKAFWVKIAKIGGLDSAEGLKMIGGGYDAYKSALRLVIPEIEKCEQALLNCVAEEDSAIFRAESHRIKGALASVGAAELSGLAGKLENASARNDIRACKTGLPVFLTLLNGLKADLEEAFSLAGPHGWQPENTDGPPAYPGGIQEFPGGIQEFPGGMRELLSRLSESISAVDFLQIDKCVRELDRLHVRGPLCEPVERLKDLILIMEYDGAAALIRDLIEMAERGGN